MQPFTMSFAVGPYQVRVVVTNAEAVLESPPEPLPVSRDELLPNEREVEMVLTEQVKSAKEIAHAIGHDRPSGQLYATLRSLCAKRIAEHAPGGGYRRRDNRPSAIEPSANGKH